MWQKEKGRRRWSGKRKEKTKMSRGNRGSEVMLVGTKTGGRRRKEEV